MIEHLSDAMLNALADDELSLERLETVQQHLETCQSCTAMALQHSRIKSATAKAGQRYAPSTDFQLRMMGQIRRNSSTPQLSRRPKETSLWPGTRFYGWATACVLLLIIATAPLIQLISKRFESVKPDFPAIVTEALDQHIASLAATAAPQVISSDRHTVKPWFQGKLPFSFNLPENLPPGTSLDGANLTYLHNRPAAQLLYSIGKHRVSVYLRQSSAPGTVARFTVQESGFQVARFSAGAIEGIAVSDVDPSRLADLVGLIIGAQTEIDKPSR